MGFQAISFIFIGITLVLLSTSTCAIFDPQSMCTGVKGVNDPQFCEQLMQNVRANGPSDSLKATIETTLAKTIEAQKLFQNLFTNTKSEDKEAFDKCKDFYESAIYDLNKSLESIESKDRRTFHIYLSSALVYYDACNDVSSRGGPGGWIAPPPDVAKVNTPLQKLTSNVLFATRFELP